ncbi:MAG: PEGA domain-containing protein [Algoriphagus sp.]
MRIKLFSIFLFLPLLSFAQLKEFKILKLPDETGKEIFTRPELDSSVYVFVYVSNNFGKSLKFEPFMKWSVDPKYNEEKSRWELFVPIELKQKISIWADGYNAQEILIAKTKSPKTTFSYSIEIGKNSLNVETIPSDAAVILEELDKEFTHSSRKTPTIFSDVSGAIKLSITKENFFPKDTAFTLGNGETKVFFQLDSANKQIRVRSTPSGADLYLDKAKIGITPFEGFVPFGDHILSLKKENFYEYDTTLQITREKNFNLDLKLEQIRSNVNIKSNPSGAKIWIDNEERKQVVTPYTIQNLPLGEHQLKLKKDGYEELTTKFLLSAADGKLLTIEENLVKITKDQVKSKKTTKGVTIALGLGGIGAGLYLMQSANKNYEAYQKATSSSEASSLRKQVESADQLAPFALGLGGLSIGVGFAIKTNK